MSSRSGFDRIIGQQLAKRVLIGAVREGRVGHAYLFLGLQGTGKLTTALEFAKALKCESPIAGQACGICSICRAIEHGNFPDIRVWSPKGQNTTIDSMREMRELSTFRPSRGKWAVNIIEQGDTLNEEAANCILKLLEEPPDYLINILLFRNSANVLPTIRSRCQLVRFEQANSNELAERLIEDYGASVEEAALFSHYSQGRPGEAITLLRDSEFLSVRETIADIADATSGGNVWAALRLAEKLRGGASETPDAEGDAEESSPTQPSSVRRGVRETTLWSLDILLIWYRDLLAISLLGEEAEIINNDKREALLRQAKRHTHAGHLLKGIDAILRASRRIKGNANPQIATELLMMTLA